jgi:hypothetical protein
LRQTALALLSFLVLHAQAATSQPIPVADELADMVEQVVSGTGISINIASQTRTSVTIDKVNGVTVCAQEARGNVEKLQLAFEAHPSIYRNVGPALASVTESDGTKRRPGVADVQPHGPVGSCQGIYVSIRE